MEQAVPGFRLSWQAHGEKFMIVVLTAGNEIVFQFVLDKAETKLLSAEIDRWHIASNGSLLHLPGG